MLFSTYVASAIAIEYAIEVTLMMPQEEDGYAIIATPLAIHVSFIEYRYSSLMAEIHCRQHTACYHIADSRIPYRHTYTPLRY